MIDDAKFEDADERPLYLQAVDQDDLQIISTLIQDSILSGSDITWRPKQRRFAMLINRYRWESSYSTPQRVQSLLVFNDVFQVQENGLSQPDGLVLSILALTYSAAADQDTGQITIQLAGDGEIRLHVECINAALRDSSQPYAAPSGNRPKHILD